MTRTYADAGFGTLFSTVATLISPAQSMLDGRTSYEAAPRLALRAPGRRPLRPALDTLLTWSERTRQRRELMQFDDHLLRDIGVTRAEAIAEAGKPFWRA